jgi:hypothetical protein
MELAKADLVGPGDWEMLAEYAASQTTLEQMYHPSPPVAPDLLEGANYAFFHYPQC